QVAAHPATRVAREAEGVAALPNAAGEFVRQEVDGIRIAAALDDRQRALIIEVLQPDESGMQSERRSGAGIVADGGRAEIAADPGAQLQAGARCGISGAQLELWGNTHSYGIGRGGDRIEAVVAAVEEDHDEIAVEAIEVGGQRLAQEWIAEEAGTEESASGYQSGAFDELSSCQRHRLLSLC